MKYNWSIIGHEAQLELIEKDLLSGNLSHAYLLSGPNSVGKHTVLKKMAGILQCENNFCHTCPTCIQVERSSHIDTFELVDDSSTIGIETVRHIVEMANHTTQSKYKIFIIQSIDRFSLAAAHSFLKVLEEPPLGTIFLLSTNRIQDILPTIISRVRLIRFGHVSEKYLEKKLFSLFPDTEKDTLIKSAFFSLGKTGKALNLANHPEKLAKYMKFYSDIQHFLKYFNVYDRFSYVSELLEAEDDRDLKDFLNILAHVLRTRTLKSGVMPEKEINILQKLSFSAKLLERNVNARLVLENLFLSL